MKPLTPQQIKSWNAYVEAQVNYAKTDEERKKRQDQYYNGE